MGAGALTFLLALGTLFLMLGCLVQPSPQEVLSLIATLRCLVLLISMGSLPLSACKGGEVDWGGRAEDRGLGGEE